jgi:hypothetical protein
MGNNRDSLGFSVRERSGYAFRIIKHIVQAREIHFAQYHTDRRHEHTIDQTRNDLAKSGAYDDRNSQVDNITARDEFSELFERRYSPR